MAARDLDIDPVEFRRRNLIEESRMPYKLANMRHKDPLAETWCDNGAYAEVLERCVEAFDWKGKWDLQGKKIDGRYHGLGLACFIEGGGAGREGCRMVLEKDGGVSVYVGSSAIGQGLETVLSQIASDALGLPMERIGLMHGSTTLVREGFGSFHSRSTVMGGSAVLLTAEKLIDEIKAAAARRFGCDVSAVSVRDGAATDGTTRATLAELAAEGITVEECFSNSKHTYSYGAHAVHLAVDPETGNVEILDYLTAEDVGHIINPATLHGQVLGSLVQGLGSVFMEHLQYDEAGQLLAGSFMDYALPIASNFSHLRSLLLELRPCPNNPLGAKGAGEGGLIAVGGAVANAIAAALVDFGVEPRDLPLSPAALWKLIDQARNEKPSCGG
jgi:carbon-monoxide dehydrogenase large subunit